MKYGKILTAFMLALAMCLGLTACGGDNGGDSNDNNDSIQTPPPVIEGAAYDSAADASAYGEYYGLWEGSSGAKCDTLAVSATDGGMYFTFYKDGEIMASGTGACAAVVAAVANGMCEKGRDVTVRAAGGDLVVNYTDEKITLTGDAKLVYTGEAVY